MRGSETRGNEPNGGGLQAQLDSFLAGQEDRLIAFRRDLHMHPELGYAEHRTTARIAEQLDRGRAAARHCSPRAPGLICEVGCGDGPVVALRADIDALPLPDEKDVPYRSTVPGVATPAATTCTPRCCSARRGSSPSRPPPGCCPDAYA